MSITFQQQLEICEYKRKRAFLLLKKVETLTDEWGMRKSDLRSSSTKSDELNPILSKGIIPQISPKHSAALIRIPSSYFGAQNLIRDHISSMRERGSCSPFIRAYSRCIVLIKGKTSISYPKNNIDVLLILRYEFLRFFHAIFFSKSQALSTWLDMLNVDTKFWKQSQNDEFRSRCHVFHTTSYNASIIQ